MKAGIMQDRQPWNDENFSIPITLVFYVTQSL